MPCRRTLRWLGPVTAVGADAAGAHRGWSRATVPGRTGRLIGSMAGCCFAGAGECSSHRRSWSVPHAWSIVPAVAAQSGRDTALATLPQATGRKPSEQKVTGAAALMPVLLLAPARPWAPGAAPAASVRARAARTVQAARAARTNRNDTLAARHVPPRAAIMKAAWSGQAPESRAATLRIAPRRCEAAAAEGPGIAAKPGPSPAGPCGASFRAVCTPAPRAAAGTGSSTTSNSESDPANGASPWNE